MASHRGHSLVLRLINEQVFWVEHSFGLSKTLLLHFVDQRVHIVAHAFEVSPQHFVLGHQNLFLFAVIFDIVKKIWIDVHFLDFSFRLFDGSLNKFKGVIHCLSIYSTAPSR